ncbi:MAG: hypothetical protein EOP85_14515 [Verrucomicrobiaceae bacterium]|nr:MAG: hypothetical protein EOP85_14515 [Verrucomicrobiaceae bacterium]
MRSNVISSLVALAMLTGNAFALTPVQETFSGQFNQERWYQYAVASGRLIQKGDVLNYSTKSKATKNDFSSIELLTSQPGFAEDWQLTLDLSNTSNLGKKAAGGIMIFNVQDRKDYLYLEYYGKSGVAGGVIADQKHVKKGRISLPQAIAKGSLRVTYRVATKLLTLEVLVPKGKKTKWFTVGTFSPLGDKKGDVRANWKMNADSRFGVQLFGFSESKKVENGKITFDNFTLSAPAAP